MEVQEMVVGEIRFLVSVCVGGCLCGCVTVVET